MTALSRLFLLYIVATLLAACAASPEKPAPHSVKWEEHRALMTRWDAWAVSGKIALRTPERAESASLEWLQRAGIGELQLSGPLGMAATRVQSDGESLTITRGDNVQQIDASSPASIQAATGWPLPVHQLPFWLRGIPAPGETQQETINDGLLRQLRQDGWSVEYQDYGDFDGLRLPTRIRVEGSDLSARLILRQWREAR